MRRVGDARRKISAIGRIIRYVTGLSVLLIMVAGIHSLAYGFEWRQGRKNHEVEEVGSTVRNNRITFENDKVEAGIPLIVTGAPTDTIYEWTMTSADGSKNSFTTSGNSYTPSESDLEKLITVTADGMEGSEAVIYYSDLPVVYINNDAGYYSVADEYSEAEMSMQGNDTYSDREQLYTGEIRIRLRGNSTREREKKPFNIKLGSKADLLGMGKSKHFALLANDIDHTLMRNQLLYDFSGDIGMDTYSKSESVVLIFNNRYYGVYQLCETVTIEPERVPVFDWEESAETAAKAIVTSQSESGRISEEAIREMKSSLEDALCEDLSWITEPHTFSYDTNSDGIEETYTITDYIDLPAPTGGVLLEMDFFAFDNHNPSTMITEYSQPIYFKAPEYAITNPTLYDNIRTDIQVFEYALHSSDFTYHESDPKYQAMNRNGGNKDPGYQLTSDFTAPEYDGRHYSEVFDLDSLVQNFLVCEFSMNWDGMKNSVFFYKDIDGLFHVGPEWDFDWAWGNINMYGVNTWYPTSWHTTEEDFTIEQYYQTVQWNRYLIRDPYFLVRAYEKYNEIRGTVIEDLVKEGGKIDSLERKLASAAVANYGRWKDTYDRYRSEGFAGSMLNLREFIGTRLEWMDNQFATLKKFVASLGYYVPDQDLRIAKIDTGALEGYTEITASIADDSVSYVTFRINGTRTYTVEVVDGIAECQVSKDYLIGDHDKYNVVEIMAKDSTDEYIIKKAEEGNYASVKSNYAVFSLKDGIVEPVLEFERNVSEGGNNNTEDKTGLDKNSDNAGQKQISSDAVAQETASQQGSTPVVDPVILVVTIGLGMLLLTAGTAAMLRNRRREGKTDHKDCY